MHYSFMGEMRLPFIDSYLLYRGALKCRFDYIIFQYFNFCCYSYYEGIVMVMISWWLHLQLYMWLSLLKF